MERLDWVDGFWRLLLGMANDKTCRQNRVLLVDGSLLTLDLQAHALCANLPLPSNLFAEVSLAGCARFNGGGRIRVQQARAVFLKGQLQSHKQQARKYKHCFQGFRSRVHFRNINERPKTKFNKRNFDGASNTKGAANNCILKYELAFPNGVIWDGDFHNQDLFFHPLCLDP